eukprot:TRINITY_DN22902_c0_g1_i1.p1 TRINITY_DN22902_c0_g1~~TRINITY_DN22902_c0_g1_i1.p1  ORF type:complete len:121 (-),score=15.64 TRINITY_DN22902_c0_g1_i1:29-391(-)
MNILRTFFRGPLNRRWFATAAESTSFKGRSKLTEFYKLTHPDMLSNAPANVKEENLRSIKIINSYLDGLSRNQGVQAERVKLYLADKTNRKSRRFHSFEVELPTIRSGIAENVVQTQLEK